MPSRRTGFINLYLLAGAVLLALFFLWGIARNWSCRSKRPPRPPVSRSYSVVRVTSGAAIEVKTGLRGKKTATVTLVDIDASRWPEEAKKHLEELAGKTIRVEQPRHGLFRATAQDGRQDGEGTETEVLPEVDGVQPQDAEEVEARGPIVGVVFGESGACLNLAQVADGFVTCLPSADKTWKAEEEKARKAKRGMWGKK